MIPQVVLENDWVRLEPLEEHHRVGLEAASLDPSVWTYKPVDATGGPAQRWFQIWFDAALVARERGELPFAVVRREDGRIVGSTRYLNTDLPNRRVEIGNTHYEPAARGTFVNPACKRLLLAHAFEGLGCVRVELRCDARNGPSRAAIVKLGARQEGLFRRHMRLGDGFIRDTVVFAIIDEDWPALRDRLDRRLAGVDLR